VIGLLYPDAVCPACGQTHALHDPDAARHRRRAAYRYTCPTTGVAVVFHLPTTPQPVLTPPANAVPLTRVAD
jgi:hypothetical protein